MDTAQIYNLIGRVLIKIPVMKRTKRESEKLPGSTHPSTCVSRNVAKTFLALIDERFPKDKRLRKIFNRNTIKVSNSCLPNVKQTISNNKPPLTTTYCTEWRNQLKIANYVTVGKKKTSCPLHGKCVTNYVEYKATVTETTLNKQETYIRLTENDLRRDSICISHLSKLEHKENF